jgi:hypothetical protein
MARNRSNQGQVLIVAALVIAVMLLSTALYIADAQKTQLKADAETSLNLPFYKQGIEHTMICALVNISNGGDPGILQTDLDSFNTFVSENSFEAFFTAEVTLRDTDDYQNGVWQVQNQSGTSIISAYATLNVDSSGTNEEMQSVFDKNVTSMIQTQGSYTQDNTSKQVQLTCQVFNEGQSALAGNFSVSYEKDGSLESENWTTIESPNIINPGDGTYTISFEAPADQPENPLLIWLSCQDQRGILLQTLVEPELQP